jgi:hypothetical protein
MTKTKDMMNVRLLGFMPALLTGPVPVFEGHPPLILPFCGFIEV